MACNCTDAILSNCSNEDLIALGGIIASIGCSPLGTNLTYMPNPTGGTMLSSTGTPAFIPIVNTTNAGLVTPELYAMILTSAGSGSVGPGTPNTVSKFITPSTVGDSNIIDNGNLFRYNSNTPSTSVSSIFELYASGVIRSKIIALGQQVWYVNGGAGEVGSIIFDTPANNPGITFFNFGNTSRTDIRLHSQTGGLAFVTNNTGTGDSVPQMLLTTDGALGLGTTTTNLARFTVSGSFSPVVNNARGIYVAVSLTATANNDNLVGVDINPTYTVGAFTGVSTIGLRLRGDIVHYGGVPNIGTTALPFGTISVINVYSGTGRDLTLKGDKNLYLSVNATKPVMAFFQITGNAVIQNGGTLVDDGVNRLQVNGTAIATSWKVTGGNSGQYLKADGSLTTYKEWLGIISQTGVAAPTQVVYENALGGSLVWSYVSVGTYRATLTGAFASGKVNLQITLSLGPGGMVQAQRFDNDNLQIITRNTAGALTDALLTEASLRVRVY